MRRGLNSNDKKEDLFKALRKRRKPVIERVAARVKEQNRIRREINKSLKEGAKTVPAIAESTGIPSSTVFWHIIAMKKYGKVAEAEQEDDYPKYQLIEE